MAFRKARTRVANPSHKRKHRKHNAAARKSHTARHANPRRKRRAARRTNGYAAAAAPSRKRRRKSIRRHNGYKRHGRRKNPEMGGKLLTMENVAMVAGAGVSTALVMAVLERTDAAGKLGIVKQEYKEATNAAASAALGATIAHFTRGKRKISKFFWIHSLVSGGTAFVLLAKGKAKELAEKALPASTGSTGGMFIPPPKGDVGLLQADLKGIYLPAPKGDMGLIQQDIGKSPARSFGK